jgi:hypothetical protein
MASAAFSIGSVELVALAVLASYYFSGVHKRIIVYCCITVTSTAIVGEVPTVVVAHNPLPDPTDK